MATHAPDARSNGVPLRCAEVNTPAQKDKAVIRQSKSATTTPKLLSRVEALRLLSRVEEAGLLSLGASSHKWACRRAVRGVSAAARAHCAARGPCRALVALPLSRP